MSQIEQWHFALLAPWGRTVLIIGLVLAALGIGFSLWGLRYERSLWRRGSLAALRALGLLAALACFLEPGVEFEDVMRLPNHVAVLVDGSESMALREKVNESKRLERAAQLLAASGKVLGEWRQQHKIDFYTWGDHLKPSSEMALAPGSPRLAELQEPATRLGEALEELRSRYATGDLAGVVVISDGIDHGRWAAGGMAEGRDWLRDLGVPVHTIWTGKPGLRDLAMARVMADDFAFARNVVKVEAVVRSLGVKAAGWKGKSIPVTLRRDGVVLRTHSLTLDEHNAEQKVTFEFTPDRVGKYLYEISVPVLEGDMIPLNNARAFQLKVIRDRVRVLQLAGRPSWDVRFLRGLLKHDPNVDLISFFILRTPEDVENATTEELSLIPFPTKELFVDELRSFDVVFMQNLDFTPYGIGPYLGEIKRFVDEGGGLAMLGGDLSFSSGGYARTPVADVLPVVLLDVPPGLQGNEKLLAPDPVRLRLTPEGKNHPIMALGMNPEENYRRWETMPLLDGVNLVAHARAGATVLGVHPSLRGDDGKALPVLAVADVGKGRSLALTTDSAWRWGFGMAALEEGETRGRAYQRFWENAMRWLIHDPELRLLHVEAVQAEFARDEKVRLQVRARDPAYRPLPGLEVTFSLVRYGGQGAAPPAIPTVLRTDDRGTAQLELPPLPPGGYRITARGRMDKPKLLLHDDEVFIVQAASRELEDPEARAGLLREVAQASGGVARTVEEGLAGLSFRAPRVVRVSRKQDVELWSTWVTLLIAAAAWATEWSLRRRWGLT